MYFFLCGQHVCVTCIMFTFFPFHFWRLSRFGISWTFFSVRFTFYFNVTISHSVVAVLLCFLCVLNWMKEREKESERVVWMAKLNRFHESKCVVCISWKPYETNQFPISFTHRFQIGSKYSLIFRATALNCNIIISICVWACVRDRVYVKHFCYDFFFRLFQFCNACDDRLFVKSDAHIFEMNH